MHLPQPIKFRPQCNLTAFANVAPRNVLRCCAEQKVGGASAPRRRRRRTRTAQTKKPAGAGLLNVMDDMMEKQYGRGTLYYGKREVKEEEVVNEDEYETLKPDPILVAGGTGRTGQWVVLGLLNQGFNVRVLTRKFENAEELFGDSGVNVDVFEGSLDDPVALTEAMDGVKSVIFVAGGEQVLFLRKSPPSAQALVDAAVQAKVERFVLVAEKDHQAASEDALQKSNIPHFVVKPTKLTDNEGGLRTVEFDKQMANQSNAICRLDLAQVLCQVLVHDRFINGMKETDPQAGFEFPNASIHVFNGNSEFVPEDKYWRQKFVSLRETPDGDAS